MTIASVGFETTPHTVGICVIHRVALSVAVPIAVPVRHGRQAHISSDSTEYFQYAFHAVHS